MTDEKGRYLKLDTTSPVLEEKPLLERLRRELDKLDAGAGQVKLQNETDGRWIWMVTMIRSIALSLDLIEEALSEIEGNTFRREP